MGVGTEPNRRSANYKVKVCPQYVPKILLGKSHAKFEGKLACSQKFREAILCAYLARCASLLRAGFSQIAKRISSEEILLKAAVAAQTMFVKAQNAFLASDWLLPWLTDSRKVIQ